MPVENSDSDFSFSESETSNGSTTPVIDMPESPTTIQGGSSASSKDKMRLKPSTGLSGLEEADAEAGRTGLRHFDDDGEQGDDEEGGDDDDDEAVRAKNKSEAGGSGGGGSGSGRMEGCCSCLDHGHYGFLDMAGDRVQYRGLTTLVFLVFIIQSQVGSFVNIIVRDIAYINIDTNKSALMPSCIPFITVDPFSPVPAGQTQATISDKTTDGKLYGTTINVGDVVTSPWVITGE